MSGQRLEPDREAERLREALAAIDVAAAGMARMDARADFARVAITAVPALLAELDAVRASLALVEGQAHRATQALTASTTLLAGLLTAIVPEAKMLRARVDARIQANQVALGLATPEADKAAGWGDATRGAEDER